MHESSIIADSPNFKGRLQARVSLAFIPARWTLVFDYVYMYMHMRTCTFGFNYHSSMEREASQGRCGW